MASPPTLNSELLDATLAEVRRAARRERGSEQRPTWDQGWWRQRCGTALCFAGWACQVNGDTWADSLQPPGTDFPEELVVPARGERADLEWTEAVGMRVVHCEDAAQRRLGLTSGEANVLFRSRNSLRDLTRIVRKIKAGEYR